MEATIQIDGRPVRFKSTAAVPLLYRVKFHRDMIRDVQEIADALKGKEATGATLPMQALTVFERMAYIMAKHADPSMAADSPEEWLEGFETMSIYEVFPVVEALWTGNVEGLEEAKKKLGESTGNLTPPCSCSELCSSACRCGT